MLVISGEEALETKHCANQHRRQRNCVYALTAEVVFWNFSYCAKRLSFINASMRFRELA
jgi:hypothetical protein